MEQAIKNNNSIKKDVLHTTRCCFTSNLFFDLPEGRVLVLKELYLSNIACFLHLYEREKQEKDKEPLDKLYETSSGKYEKALLSVKKVKSTLRNLMYLTANYLEQYGLQIPLYCIVSTSVKPDTSEIIKMAKDLSNDQDWSRGNFAILTVKKDNKDDKDEVEKVIEKIILDIELNEIEFMEPISTGIFEKRLREEMRSIILSGDHEELIEIIINSIVTNLSPEQLIEIWVKGKLEDIENYAKKVIL
jgi:hypothetical protein